MPNNLIEDKGFLSVHENNWDSIKTAYIPLREVEKE